MQKSKMAAEEDLHIAVKRREVKRTGEKEKRKDIASECKVPNNIQEK